MCRGAGDCAGAKRQRCRQGGAEVMQSRHKGFAVKKNISGSEGQRTRGSEGQRGCRGSEGQRVKTKG
jgi:hypothetical protein